MKKQTTLYFDNKNSQIQKNQNMDLQEKLLKPDKTFRDAVHGDIMLTELEVKLIDTKDFQRLRGIRQLGTSHLVYYCANHTRLDHSIGCVHMADKIITYVNNNPYSDIHVEPYERFQIRLSALLHDLSHIPFGHTLEDEAGIFKNDKGETLGQWKDEDRLVKFLGKASDVAKVISNYGLLKQLEESGFTEYEPEKVLNDLSDNIKAIEFHTADNLKKPYIADIIGNTLCADLLDYIRRDIHFTGLHEDYDERFLSYLYITNYERKPRLVLRLHKPRNKRLRRDVLSELLHLLRLRYSLAEKVYYHHAKISSSAMIISAVASLFIETQFDKKILYDISDDALIRIMKEGDFATEVSKFILKHYEAHWLYQPVFGLKFGGDLDAKSSEKDNLKKTLTKKEKRYELERYLEKIHDLPAGSIIIYCPNEGMGAKPAEVLVDKNGTKIGPLFSIKHPEKSVAPKRVKDEIESSIIQKHKELWCMYVFVEKELSRDTMLMKLINGDCEDILALQNELEECIPFWDSTHNHRYNRFEEKFIRENSEYKQLEHDQIHEVSHRGVGNKISFGEKEVQLLTYDEYDAFRINIEQK